jgi:hypothetical protein
MDEPIEGLGSFLPVLKAYATDIAHRRDGEPLTPHDGEWIAVGTLLSHAGSVPVTKRGRLLAQARTMIRDLLGEPLWTQGPPLDAAPPNDRRILAPRVRLLCEQVEDAGAIHLADALVGAYLLSGDEIDALERGRIAALRGRFAWKRGDHATAFERYRRVRAIARRIGSTELEVRAEIGFAVVARQRGNYPASRSAARRAVELGEANGFIRLAALGHQLLMVAAVVAGDLNTALQHSWLAYANVRGDVIDEAAHLVDTAQLFLDAGHADVASAGFSAALERRIPDRIRLPALGGAALAAARQGDERTIERMADDVRRTVNDGLLPYASVVGRLDVAEALESIGHLDAAAPFRHEAEMVASAHRYHELVHRAQRLPATTRAPTTVQPLTEATLEIGAAVRALVGAGV